MVRPADEARRGELLEGAADYLLAHGLSGLSLASVAAETGTSARMLVHYFGTRDALVTAALAIARARQRAAFEAWMAPGEAPSYGEVLRRAWARMTSADGRPFLRLYVELAALSRLPGSEQGAFAPRAVLDWLPVVAAGMRPFAKEGFDPVPLATVVVSAVRGSVTDLVATGDDERIAAGIDELATMVDARLAAS